MIEADRYPAAGQLGIIGLLPARHYRLSGAARGFARSDPNGSILIAVEIAAATLLLIEPVV